MSWYPKAVKKEIPPGSNDPYIIPVGLVYHVRAGEGDTLYPYFNGPSGGVESHWYIRYDGTVEQYRDTNREADANYKGNSWVSDGRRYGLLSVETEGLEHGEWTDEQTEALKDLTLWASKDGHWPIQLCPDSNGPGVGYHVMFGAPGPWTSVAKTCPGPDRVKQFQNIFVPWINGNPEKEEMVELSEKQENEIAREVNVFRRPFHGYIKKHWPATAKKWTNGYTLHYFAEMSYARTRRLVEIVLSSKWKKSIGWHVWYRQNETLEKSYGRMAREDNVRIAECHDMLSDILEKMGAEPRQFTSVALGEGLFTPDPDELTDTESDDEEISSQSA